MKPLITSQTIAFTKPNCGCGIVSSNERTQFLKSQKLSKKNKTKTKTKYRKTKYRK